MCPDAANRFSILFMDCIYKYQLDILSASTYCFSILIYSMYRNQRFADQDFPFRFWISSLRPFRTDLNPLDSENAENCSSLNPPLYRVFINRLEGCYINLSVSDHCLKNNACQFTSNKKVTT